MQPFTIKDQILNQKWPSAEYQRRKGPKKSVQWGQRKLLLTEIQFFTNYWDNRSVPNPIVIYVGAAPGIHIELLSQLFPLFNFHLYDPKPFAIKPTSNISIYNQKFTDGDCKRWAGRSDVFFVCDIRSAAPGEDIKTGDDELKRIEDGIKNDMVNQRTWVEIIKPVQAHLKFRLPYPYSWTTELKFNYFKGFCYVQPWAMTSSTETRLVPEKVNGGYVYATYDIKDYE